MAPSMSDEKVNEGLIHFRVARRRLMRAARVADETRATIAHVRLMFAIDALDDAEDAFKQATGYRRLMEDVFEVPPGRFDLTAQEIADLPVLDRDRFGDDGP